MAGECGWVCRGEPWLSLAVVGEWLPAHPPSPCIADCRDIPTFRAENGPKRGNISTVNDGSSLPHHRNLSSAIVALRSDHNDED